jgi:hypothetical protein
VVFDGADMAGTTIGLELDDDCFGLTIQNCIFQNLGYGCYVVDHAYSIVFLDTLFDSCTIAGVRAGTSLLAIVDNCAFVACGTGIEMYLNGYSGAISNSRFIRCTSGVITASGGGLPISNSVFVNNTDGIVITSNAATMNLRNNVFANNSGYGARSTVAATYGRFVPFASHNCWYNNTSGHVDSNINGGSIPGHSNLTSNPLFISVVPGAEDLALQSGSPLIDAGIGFEGGM